MTARVELRPEHLAVSFRGADAFLSLKRRLLLPWPDIESVRVARRADLNRELGWRVGGGYFPGILTTGHFTWRGRRGDRQLWCVYAEREALLVIETRRARPRRVVLQVDDPAGLAARIDAVLTRSA